MTIPVVIHTLFLSTSPDSGLKAADYIQIPIAIFTMIAGIAAAYSAWVGRNSARESNNATQILKDELLAIKGQTIADAQLQLLKAYQNTQRLEQEAAEEGSIVKADRYYRESFDLLWAEYYLWRNGVILDEVMLVWVRFRYRLFNDPPKIGHQIFTKVETKFDGKTYKAGDPIASYQDGWTEFQKIFVGDTGTLFIIFVDAIHDDKINNEKDIIHYKTKKLPIS